MSRIEINSALGLGFDQFITPVEIYDENGKRLGKFVPEYDPMDDCPYTQEELDQHLAEAMADPKGGKSLAQIWKDLGQA